MILELVLFLFVGLPFGGLLIFLFRVFIREIDDLCVVMEAENDESF